MYSVKPGRGPSIMDSAGGIIGAFFTVIVVIIALSMAMPSIFALIGMICVLLSFGGGAYCFFNTKSKNRVNTCDITTNEEESNPVAQSLGHDESNRPPSDTATPSKQRNFFSQHCPYCGTQVANVSFCPKCARKKYNPPFN